MKSSRHDKREEVQMDQKENGTVQSMTDEIDLVELFYYLKRKWILITAVFLIGVVAAAAGTKLLLKPKYTAVSKLYVVSASGKNIVNLDDLRLGTTLSADYKELMKTRPVCEEIIEELGLDYTTRKLKNMIDIQPVEDTRILTVSVVSHESGRGEKYCQCYGK